MEPERKRGRSPTVKHVYEIGDKAACIWERILDQQGNNNEEIIRRLELIMANQEAFDAKITAANTALDAIAAAVAAEAQQVADFIAANPSVNTTALDGVVARLEAVDESIGTVFSPPVATPPVEPAP